MASKQGTLLSEIYSPTDLKKLKDTQLSQLCEEIRQFIINETSTNPGHLGAGLGVVELTVALHYVFNTPYDKLIWDVGHQAYAHKILTGRKDLFHLNRMIDGISGFPKMSESEYDAFGVGHASTSISAALGMAISARLQNDNKRQHIAVIGDGSMTGGQALEAMNNVGVSRTNLLVILNDNGIAIDKNVGAMKDYLTDITISRTYNRIKDKVWYLMGGNTRYGTNSRAVVRQISNALKLTLLKKSNLFEAFNFRYFGPVDGHDVLHLTKILNDLKNIPGPKLLHIVTVKGKGFTVAENNQTTFHAPGLFNPETGEIIEDKKCKTLPPKYQIVFGKTILELAEMNPKIVGITPAMPTGCSLNLMMAKMPNRAFDVGIAEQHAVTFSAGLAATGMIPFCNIYSSFMQRAYDQVIHDVALQNLNVIFCLDRGGIVGEDGATHHGVYDLAYFRCIPNITVSSPMNEVELRNLMYTAQLDNMGPFVIRYPRGRGVSDGWRKPFEKIEVGTGRRLREGKDLAILSIGHIGNLATEACKQLSVMGIEAAHYDMRFLKPIDEALLNEVFKKYDKVITIEDGTIIGGLGSAVIEFMSDHNYRAEIKRLGVPDTFIEQGTVAELYRICGCDIQGIIETAKELVGQKEQMPKA
jgi:1-deoxy-D-xylulose-5-phosphate synthase